MVRPPKTKRTKRTLATIGTAAFLSLSAAIGAPYTLYKEGMRLKPYYDSAGVKTVCAGETSRTAVEKVAYTYDECKSLFATQYGYYSTRVSYMYNDTARALITPKTHAAFTDMGYNIGLPALKKSSMIREANNGRLKQACDAILRYKYITRSGTKYDCSTPNNKICYGLWVRRLELHDMCLGGIE